MASQGYQMRAVLHRYVQINSKASQFRSSIAWCKIEKSFIGITSFLRDLGTCVVLSFLSTNLVFVRLTSFLFLISSEQSGNHLRRSSLPPSVQTLTECQMMNLLEGCTINLITLISSDAEQRDQWTQQLVFRIHSFLMNNRHLICSDTMQGYI